MNRLQQLLKQEQRQYSLREIAHKADVDHSGLSRCLNHNATPNAVNLEKLSKYFAVDFYSLLDPVVNNGEQRTPSESYLANLSTVQRLAVETILSFPDGQILEALVLLRRSLSAPLPQLTCQSDSLGFPVK